jgi:hypothetical protein
MNKIAESITSGDLVVQGQVIYKKGVLKENDIVTYGLILGDITVYNGAWLKNTVVRGNIVPNRDGCDRGAEIKGDLIISYQAFLWEILDTDWPVHVSGDLIIDGEEVVEKPAKLRKEIMVCKDIIVAGRYIVDPEFISKHCASAKVLVSSNRLVRPRERFDGSGACIRGDVFARSVGALRSDIRHSGPLYIIGDLVLGEEPKDTWGEVPKGTWVDDWKDPWFVFLVMLLTVCIGAMLTAMLTAKLIR